MPHVSNSHQSPYGAPATQHGPQVGMVHPLPHGQHASATYAPGSAVYGPGLERQRSYSNPRKSFTFHCS